jgi:hypothetical protein
MGDPKNIVEKFFEEAGQTDAIGKAGVVQAKKNMMGCYKQSLTDKSLKNQKSSIDACLRVTCHKAESPPCSPT